MEKKTIINRTITLTLPLTETAKSFGYNLEVDSYEDVYHNGYKNKDVRKMDLRLPENLDGVNEVFPSAVSRAMEDAERDAYASAIRKERISALKSALEKIDLGTAEYQDTDGDHVSAKAGLISAEASEKDDTISVTILNPEHLLNAIIDGMGYVYPDLSSVEPATDSELISRIHNLNDYFKVYGESKPSGDLSSQFTPDIDDTFFADEIRFHLGEMSLSEVAEAVVEYVDSSDVKPTEAIAQASKFVEFTTEEIKAEIINDIKDKEDFWTKA